MGKLSGKVAIVTGSATGIGKGSARVMAKHGAKVMMFDRSHDVFGAAEEIRGMGYETEAMVVDVTDTASIKTAVDAVIAKYQKIDILHNNAGVSRRQKFEDAEDATRDFIFGVNIYGVWNMTKAVYPHMMKAGYGRIVITASVTGPLVVDEGQCCYALSKAAMIGFTKALAIEAAAYGITVNAICPGYVLTPMVKKVAASSRPEDPESAIRDMEQAIPLKRLCTTEEVGELAAFLASDESGYITGTQVVIDGGSTLPETFGVLHA